MLMYANAMEVMPVSAVVVNNVNQCWYSAIAQLFHISKSDSYCYNTSIFPPKFHIDLASMKYMYSIQLP